MLEVQCPIHWIHTSWKTKLQMTKHYSIVIKDSNADLTVEDWNFPIIINGPGFSLNIQNRKKIMSLYFLSEI